MEIILHGHKAKNGLYMISLTKQDTHPVLKQFHKSNIKTTTNNAYSVSSKREIIAYYHKIVLSPATSTWIEAIKKDSFVIWKGLAVETVKNTCQSQLQLHKAT